MGLPVMAGPHMRRIGRVREVLVSADGVRICGLVLDEGGVLHPRRVLDFRAVKAVGETHLLAEERYLSEEGQTRCCQDLHGMPVLRSTGEEVGCMDDFHFDPATGRITALQLSRGFVDDLLSGKEIVPVSGPLLTGESAILLDGAGDLSGGAFS